MMRPAAMALAFMLALALSGCDARDPGDAGAGSHPAACTTGPCPETCFRGVTCVATRGDTPIECGCCGCAAGYVDTVSCE